MRALILHGIWLGCLAVCIPLCHQWHVQLADEASRLPQSQSALETLPSAEALRLLSLGYTNVVADYYWLRAISHFGDRRAHKTMYVNLGPLLERVVALDPLFAGAYVFAGSSLTFKGMDWRVPIALLKQGMERRPDDWRIAFFLGFNAYYLIQDYALATKAMSHAATLAGAPSFVGQLATRLAAEAGEPEMGLALIDAMLAGTTDRKLLAMYQERRNLLLLEVELRQLQNSVDVYKARRGTLPSELNMLVHEHILEQIPADPTGGDYYLEGGRVKTTHENIRLRLQPAAKGQTQHASGD